MKNASRDAAVIFCLLIMTTVAYWPALSCDFVRYDDPDFVTENYRIQQGITPANVAWAFTHTFCNWIPVDTLSHMLDCQLFGLNPRGHHAMNLAFHAANAGLLFLLLRLTTRMLWPSLLAAALFALHPFNVEPVTWISSRKDVLSTFLALLTVLVYLRYTKRPALWRYLAVLGLFTLALMAKPMVVTLPLLLVLLDYWPIGRFDEVPLRRFRRVPLLYLDKIPMCLIGAAFIFITYRAQSGAGAIQTPVEYPFQVRLSNAVVSYVTYLRKTVWPTDFAAFYPHPGKAIPLTLTYCSALLLIVATALAVQQRKTRPWIAVGWFWFAIALLPVSGIAAQLGGSAMADRYAYVPLIGIFIVVAWAAFHTAQRFPRARRPIALIAVVALAALATDTSLQIRHWKNTEALWLHAIAVTKDNPAAHNGLGKTYLDQGRLDKAAYHLGEALRICPNDFLVHNNYGILKGMQGDTDGAAQEFELAIRLKPDYGRSYGNLAKCRFEQNNFTEARRLLIEAIRYTDPYDPSLPMLKGILAKLSAAPPAGNDVKTQ